MKLNANKIKEAEEWVEKNGLFPQACGASLRDFCAAMGIDQRTYYRWDKIADFADALTRARKRFHDNTVRDVENALVTAARGAEYSIVKEEKKLNPVTGKLETVKATRKTFRETPNIEAAKFVLSNMNPDKWRLKQEQTLQAEVTQYVVKDEQEKKKLENIGEGDV